MPLDARVDSFAVSLGDALRDHQDVDRKIRGIYLVVAIAGLLEHELGRPPTQAEFDRDLWELLEIHAVYGRVGKRPELRLVGKDGG